MGFWQDIGNNVGNFFNGGADNIANGMGKIAGSLGSINYSGPTSQDPLGSLNYQAPDWGSADVGSGAPANGNAGQLGALPSVERGPSGGSGLVDTSSTGPNATGPSGTDPSQGQTLLSKMMGMLEQPALGTDQLSKALQGMSVDKLDYLKLAQQNYQNILNQIGGVQQGVNNRYDQVATDMNDLYNQDSAMAKLGGNNVLTSIAGNQGQAIQNNAANAANTLANLKNSQLAQRAQIAAQAGQNPANAPQGDAWRIDPNEVAVQGIVQNAQQAANNANAAAADRTQLNNDMADALKAQGLSMGQQLQNEKMGYNASMGKYLADLANQESTRELDAVKQNRADQLAILNAQIGLQEQQATLENSRLTSLLGNHGFPDLFQTLGTYGLDQAKAAQALAAVSGGSPIASAIQNAGQYGTTLQDAYNRALINGMNLTPGQKPTYEDVYRGMNNAGVDLSGIPQNIMDGFVQQATAAKPTGSSDVTDLMNQILSNQ